MVSSEGLLAHHEFAGDPPAIPNRSLDDRSGPSVIVRGRLRSTEADQVTLDADTVDGRTCTVRVGIAGEGVLRIQLFESSPQGEEPLERQVGLVQPFPSQHAEVVNGEGSIELVTEGLRARVTLDPWNLVVTDASGRELFRQSREENVLGELAVLPFGVSLVGGVRVAFHEAFTVEAREHFYGFGEKFASLDKRGQEIESWNVDAWGAESERSYKNVPFFVSSRGYGVLVDSPTAVRFDVAASNKATVGIVVPDDRLDYYVLAGPGPREVLQRYVALTGEIAVPPKWAFGTWISGSYTETQEQVIERARTIRARRIPCDVIHIDALWQKFGCFSDLQWDEVCFPDPVAMFDELHRMEFRVCLWTNPYVGVESPLFEEAAAEGFFLKTIGGDTYVADIWGSSHPPVGLVDFTNPAAKAWYQGLLKKLFDQGADVFKTDFAEGVPFDSVAFNGMRGDSLHNVYSLLYNGAVNELTRLVKGYDLVWGRSSYIGGQRFPAQWSGDPNCTWQDMAATLRGGMSYAMSGFSFWSHDIGGCRGVPSDDLMVRWAQFGMFSPLSRFHGLTTRLPWTFRPETEAAVTDAIRARYRLLPYIYSNALTSAKERVPLLQPLVVAHPEDPGTYEADLEYLLGPDLLVAPVCNAAGRSYVYFCQGDWVDIASGELRRGPGYQWVDKTLESLPVFVRLGAILPVAGPMEVVGDSAFDRIGLDCYVVGASKVDIADDDGITSVSAERRGDLLEVHSRGPKAVEFVRCPLIAGHGQVKGIVLNGDELTVSSDTDGAQVGRAS